jgi:hypothetical protein
MHNKLNYEELTKSLERIAIALSQVQEVLQDLENEGVIDVINDRNEFKSLFEKPKKYDSNAWKKSIRNKTLVFASDLFNHELCGLNRFIDVKSDFFQSMRYEHRITNPADQLKLLEQRKIIETRFTVLANGKKKITSFKFIRSI